MNTPLISYLHLLRAITAEEGQLIQSYFELKNFKEGDYLLKEGTVCHEEFFICSGVLRILSFNDKGVERTHFFYKENQFCTVLQSFQERSISNASIQAACDTTVFAITRTKLLALYVEVPYMKELMDFVNQQRMLDKINIRNTYIGEDAETQYKLFIMHQPDIALRVALKDIASYLGITPQSLSRIRKNIR